VNKESSYITCIGLTRRIQPDLSTDWSDSGHGLCSR